MRIDAASVVEFLPGYHPDAPRAEVQALFFLAGWREHPAARETLAPTLICIDAPPPSVCWLAEQTGARLVQRPPFVRGDGTVFNRARAWDPLPGESAARRLALDPEVLMIGDPSPALASLSDATLAAAPAKKAQIPAACWPTIYRAVDVAMPTERMQPLRARLGLPVAGQGAEMPPLYHPAILLTPGNPAVGELWARHGERLAAAWPTLEGLSDSQRDSASTLERVALATALQSWRAAHGNAACEPLPRACDGRRLYLEAGVPLGELAFLHVPGLFRELTGLAQIEAWLEIFAVRWRELLLEAARQNGRDSVRTRWWVARQTRHMESALRRLYRRHVRPALRMGGELW